jgi:hypothetical protein
MGRLKEAQETVKRLRSLTAIVVPSVAHWRNLHDRELYLDAPRSRRGSRDSRIAQKFELIINQQTHNPNVPDTDVICRERRYRSDRQMAAFRDGDYNSRSRAADSAEVHLQ